MEINEAYLSLAGTVFGGVGLKIVESFLTKKKSREDVATHLRNELRTENQSLRDELHKMEASVDEWRDKYYALISKLAEQGIKLE